MRRGRKSRDDSCLQDSRTRDGGDFDRRLLAGASLLAFGGVGALVTRAIPIANYASAVAIVG